MDFNFDKKLEKELQLNFGCDLKTANKRQLYEAVILVTNQILAEKRYAYQKEVQEKGLKQVYYMSMEFLVGRSLKNNIYNLKLDKSVAKLLEDAGTDIEQIYEMEPDAGLGNGGLGRLASCYMDALTSQEYPATGFSIRYDFGIFKQVIQDGWQSEFPDNWLDMGHYWLVPRHDESVEVKFFGEIHENWSEDGLKTEHTNAIPVMAVPYDLYISGYDSKAVNTLRLWGAKSPQGFDFSLFSKGEYVRSTEAEAMAGSISKLLYPADDNYTGKSLRLKQQYFFVSASLQQITKKHFERYGTLDNFSDKAVIHINDTHPSLCVPELMRLLMDDYGYTWDKAWEICQNTLAYTNHTIMAEALEKWPVDLFQSHLPRIYMIVEEINRRFCSMIYEQHPEQAGSINDMAVISQGMVRMANLCFACCYNVNGVSALHTEILKDDTFSAFNRVFPGKITNVTNGIAHRRWLCQSNPGLNELLQKTIGTSFEKDLSRISEFEGFINDKQILEQLAKIKRENKERLAAYISEHNGINVDCSSIFDVQVKRLHEYKRQLLNALHILYLYRKIKYDGLRPHPRTFVFGAKASSGYFMAKEIIRFICALSSMIEKDPVVREFIKVVFIEDYNVSKAEIIIPAADISEQISQAGKEASGTGNMKLMINGAVTLGTMDGANVEIYQAVGPENIFIFGLDTPSVNDLAARGYHPDQYYHNDDEIRGLLDTIKSGGVDGKNFDTIYNYLINQDPYMNIADFASYRDAQQEVERAYTDTERFGKMSMINISRSGIFAADRAAKEYVDQIWHL